jgi:PIN domain nuclease of toxin-antitoxin system
MSSELTLNVTESKAPGDVHRDPADRFLVATARALDIPIVTRDAAILAYASAGHVRALRC